MKKQALFTSGKLLWTTLFAAIILKYAYYAYSYYPIVDDNNMYGIFRMYKDTFHDVILRYGMYTTRPAAALLDAYFWAKFWDNLGVTLVIMTILHFASCYLLYKVFEKAGLKIGIPVIIVFALLPFGSEATYWLSASTRTVVGLFFMALSLYLLCLYFEYEKNTRLRYILLASFFIVHLISLGFYEQVIALSFFSVFLLFIVKWRGLKTKWAAALPLINFGAIAFWYKLFGSTGNMATRGQVVNGHYLAHTKSVIRAVYDVWKTDFIDLYNVGFASGIKTIFSDNSYVFLSAALILCGGIFFFTLKEKYEDRFDFNLIKLITGAVIFVFPMSPFFAMSQIWICNRNLFFSFIGLGMMIESVLNVLAKNKGLAVLRGIIVSLMVFVFITANVYELSYYRNIGLIDREITSKIAKAEGSSEYLNGNKSMVLFNAKVTYIGSTAKRIENCTGSDWALSGAISAQNSILKLKLATPVPSETNIFFKYNLLDSPVLLGIDDSRNIFPVRILKKTDRECYIGKTDGSEFGRLEILDKDRAVFHLTK